MLVEVEGERLRVLFETVTVGVGGVDEGGRTRPRSDELYKDDRRWLADRKYVRACWHSREGRRILLYVSGFSV